MAGTVREARLGTRTARARLKRGRMPHWSTITAGRAHLGYQRWPGDRCGRWVLRRRIGNGYAVITIGAADDDRVADGISIFTHDEARAKAVEIASMGERPAGRITVRRAIADYLDHLNHEGRNARDAESVSITHILPVLGDVAVEDLTADRLRRWLADVAATPARRRSSRTGPQRYMPAPTDEEGVRRRRATANRVLTTLKAALNFAHAEGWVSNADAWGKRVKPFQRVIVPRTRYLTVDEATRLINACEPAFRSLVRAALETGARYSELARLRVHDFNPDAHTLTIRTSKSGKARHIVLTPEAAQFFAAVTAGRRGDDLMLPRADGQQWKPSNQKKPMRAACERARISPPIGLHGLRHTWASLSAMAGMELMVIARSLGHADLRMVERHYAHFGARLPLQGRSGGRVLTKNQVGLQRGEFLRETLPRFRIERPPVNVDPDVTALRPAELLQLLPERCYAGPSFRVVLDVGHQRADPPHALSLLPARRERQAAAAPPQSVAKNFRRSIWLAM